MYIHFVIFSVKLSPYFLALVFLIFARMLMMKGLMDHCLSQEMVVDRVRMEAELGELKVWKAVQEKKLTASE